MKVVGGRSTDLARAKET